MDKPTSMINPLMRYADPLYNFGVTLLGMERDLISDVEISMVTS